MKSRHRPFPNLIACGGLALLVSGTTLHALEATWTYDGTVATSNKWGEPTSWTSNPAFPNAEGDIARITANITGTRAITLDAPRTVGTLVIGDADSSNNYTLSTGTAGAALIFDPLDADPAVMQVVGTGTGTTGGVTVSAPVTLNARLRLHSNHIAAASISGSISGTFGLMIDNDDGVTPVGPALGVAPFSLSGTNTFTGGVTVNDARVTITNSSGLGSGPVTVQDGGGVWISGALTVANDFNLTGTGWPETLGAVGAIRLNNNATLAGNNTLSGTPGSTGGTAPDASLFPMATSGTSVGATVNGVVSGGDLLVGALSSLTGSPTAILRYVGAGISGGAARVNGTINLNGRDLYLENTSRFTGGVQRLWNLGTQVSGAGNVRIRCGGNNGSGVFDGRLGAGGGRLALTKSGTGTQTLNGDCTHVGITTVSGGTLAPGDPIGTMTGVNLNLSTGGVLAIDIDDSAATHSDKLVATGSLDITGATLTVAGTGAQPAYIIASYGTLTGTFGTINKPAGYQVVYNYNDGVSSNHIALVAVSDPYLAWLGGHGALTGGNLVFTFKRSEDSKAYLATVETGTDLATWPPAAAYPVPTTNGTHGAVTVAGENVTVTIPLDGAEKKFARLTVEIPFEP